MSNKTQRNIKQKIEKHLRVPSFVLGLKKASSAANAARDQNRKLNKKTHNTNQLTTTKSRSKVT